VVSRLATLASVSQELFPSGSVRRKLARGTFWTAAAEVSLRIGNLTAAILVARILGQTAFGQLGIVRATILMFAVFAGTGLGMAATKYVAEHQSGNPERAGRLVGLLLSMALCGGGLAMVVCYTFAVPIARTALNAQELAKSLRVGCLLIPLGAVSSVQVGILAGLQAFPTIAWIVALDALLTLLLMVGGAATYGVAGAIGGCMLAAAATFPVKNTMMKRACHQARVMPTLRGIGVELPALWSFALPSALLGVVAQPFEWLARAVLAQQAGGYAELGGLQAAYSWSQAILFLPGQVAVPLLPTLASLFSRRDRARLKDVMKLAFAVTSLTSLAVAAILVIFRHPLMVLYGSSFKSAAPVLVPLAAAYGVGGSTLAFRSLLMAAGRAWPLLLSTCVWGAAFVSVTFLWASQGAMGVGRAYLIGYVIHFGILAYMVSAALKQMTSRASG
jgi:O-antigen/teichoic acid export membrane protein